MIEKTKCKCCDSYCNVKDKFCYTCGTAIAPTEKNSKKSNHPVPKDLRNLVKLFFINFGIMLILVVVFLIMVIT